MVATGYEHLQGHRLDAGTFTVTPEEAEALVGALETSSSEGQNVHPIWAYIATQRGIDVSIAALCALADFDVSDGPMLGSVEITYGAPIRAGLEYRITGEVLGLERKVGRKTGTFDILSYRLVMTDPAQATIATCTNTFILPRREAT